MRRPKVRQPARGWSCRRAAPSYLLLAGFIGFVLSLSRGSRLDGQDPPALFLRGDPNRDGRVTLSDVFSILRYLSLGASLQCKDAADADDNGVINQTDALFLLGTIFYRQYPLPPPFFRAGADPTPDLLGCRQGLAQRGAAGGEDMDGGQAQDADEAGCSEGENGGTADLEFIHFHGTVLASPGDERIRAPVFLKSEKGLEGFTLSFQAPLEWIRLERIDFLGTVVGDLNPPPDWVHLFTGQQEAGYLAASVALSIGSSLQTFPAFHDEMVAILEFSVSEAAPLGVTIPIQFRSTPGRDGLPAILNEISRKGNPQPYNACGLKVEVVPGGDLFIRGDANRDRVVNLVDVISILRWLFVPRNEGTWVPCPDAADVDDNGQIEVTDAIEVVLYLFGRGSAPSLPFPAAGRDPEGTSPDSLGCLEEAVSG